MNDGEEAGRKAFDGEGNGRDGRERSCQGFDEEATEGDSGERRESAMGREGSRAS